MRPMVKIEALSKRYLIGGLHPGYMTFREMVADTLFAPFRALRGMASPAREVLWALKGIDLEVQHGELIGIIGRKFDEIVSFSEIEKFIETPVKWYSSGMYVRLAFSVAAHLEPEVLMMDEVLAVGDAAFQQKCLDKMREIRQQGRTIFFVSHDMPAITRLCQRAILLDRGAIVADGPPQ